MQPQHFFLLQTRQVEFYQKVLYLVSSTIWHSPQSSFWIIQMLSSKLQTGLDMYWLRQGDTSGTAGFESLAAQCVTDGSLCYFGPSSLQVNSLGPPRVVLGFLLTVLVIILTPRGEILRGAHQIEGDYQCLVCLPFSNNCAHSWFLHTKLLTYCRFSLPSLVAGLQFLFLVSCDSSLVLAIVEFGVVTVWGCGQVSFILITSSKQMPLIQVTSGGQRSLLKKKFTGLLRASNLACLLGDQILNFPP